MEPAEYASQLLNAARESAIPPPGPDGKPARGTPSALRDYAAAVRLAVLAQAALGQWVTLGAKDEGALAGLVVEAVPGNTFIGEPQIRLIFDFSKTAIPALTVEAKAAQ